MNVAIAAPRDADDDLIAEIRRYLVAVDLFRAEGREPRWSSEPGVGPRLEAAATLGMPRRRRR
jgi:hypothetical protein